MAPRPPAPPAQEPLHLLLPHGSRAAAPGGSLIPLGLGLAALALAVAALGRRDGAARPAPWAFLLVAFLVPAALLALALALAPEKATRFRLALLGLGVRAPEGVELVVEIAGRPEAAEIRSAEPGRSAGGREDPLLGRLRLDPATGRVTTEGAAGDAPGMLAVEVEGGLRPLPVVEVLDGDRIRVHGRTWELSRRRLLGPPAVLVAAGGHRVEIPRRYMELPGGVASMPIFQAHRVTQATYPLAWVEAVARWRERGSPEGGPRADEEAWRPGFLFFEASETPGGGLWLAAPGAGVTVERGGQAVEIPTDIDLPPGRRVHLLSPPRWNGRDFIAGGVRDRRSFRVHPGRRSLALVYDTPEVHSLSRGELRALEIGEREDGGRRRVSLSLGDWQVIDRSLHFRHAPDAVAVEALATVGLPEERLGGLLGEGGDLSLTTPRGGRPGRLGEPLWVGGDRHLAAVQFDRLEPPLALGLLGLVLGLGLAVAARAGGLSISGTLLAAGLQGVIAIRLLVAYRTAALAPLAQEPLELAAAAWTFVPWAVVVAALPPLGRSRTPRRGDVDLRDWLPALAGWAFSLAWSLRAGGGGARSWVWLICHLAVVAVPVARSLRVGERAAALRERTRERWLRSERRELLAWSLLPLAFLAARVALLLAGFRESLPVGGTRFALSLVHVPAAVVLEAGYLVWLHRRIGARGEARWRDLLPALGILVGVWGGPAYLVSDLGLALLHLPVFLAALAWVVLSAGEGRRSVPRSRGGRWRGWWRSAAARGPVLAPVAALLLVLGFVALPVLAQAALAVLPESARVELESERNYLSLLSFAAPAELRRVARRESEEFAIMSSVMRRYTAAPVAGRGYFESVVSPHIRSTALREHAPAVFVAAEWGVLGTAGLLLLYAVAGASGTAAAPWRGGFGGPGGGRRRARREAPFAGAVACLAALTLALPSLYMVLANYQLTLFTGKNAYLLGIDSAADVLEAAALAVLVAVGLAAVRDREARP